MATPLIDPARASQNAILAGLAASNAPLLTSLIGAASDFVVRYCGKDFIRKSYSEYIDGKIHKKGVPTLLRQYPVIEIQRVGIADAAMLVANSDTTNNARATFETIASTDGLSTASVKLVNVANGAANSVSISTVSPVTINQLATAINAAGFGWSATVQTSSNGTYGIWPSADLKPLQGAVSCFNGGMYAEVYAEIGTYSSSWGFGNEDESWGCPGSLNCGWRLDPETGELHLRVPRGGLNIRVDYTAGEATVPAAIQEAVVQLCCWLNSSGTIDYSTTETKLGPFMEKTPDELKMPGPILALLAPYRDLSRYWYR